MPEQHGQWGPVFGLGVVATHQILMRDGKVLMWRAGDEARVWDPITGRTTSTPAPFPPALSNFHCAAHVVLADGRVLAIGGGDRPHVGHHSSAVFDPVTQSWTKTADLTSPRWYPSATVLADGRVFVGNGEDANGRDVDTFEIYDPRTDKWSVVPGADRNQDLYAGNYLLPDGRIYEATPRTQTAFFDLATSGWTPGPTSGWRTIGYSESNAMYRPGKIIRSGGTPTGLARTNAATNRTGIVDLAVPSPRWEEPSPMEFPRRRHGLVILADGQVMAVGGTRQGQDPDQAVYEGEIWNPDTKRWSTVAAMSVSRGYHSAALLLPDGRILAAGGEPGDFTDRAGKDGTRTGQIYSPPYLFKGPRPTISAAAASTGYRESFSISTPQAATIESVALIRPGSATHAVNFEQRYVPLTFTRSAGHLTATAPANGNVAPPGWYMLVVKNTAGVPSAANWIQIGDDLTAGVPPRLPIGVGSADSPASVPPNVTPAGGGGERSGASTNPAPSSGDGSAGRTRARRAGAIYALAAPRRVSLRRVGTKPVKVRLRLARWTGGGPRTLGIRLYRVRTDQRRVRLPSLSLDRLVRVPGARVVTLPRRKLRRLRAGRYRLEVTLSNRKSRSTPVKRVITLVR